ncbi:endo-1,3-alpha-glucanase family glycosylhydrolase [Aeromicrobium sp.]|uniref:endo-1,3-alpha-glucanase family glycosylhydrolase n=1 Tax=Aeromicrobium sp. TaxID=1871063 RepID=UPI0019CC4153|nr:endo-1,3-alpha-glucanase family glycosylhydrolase [Aeromicrobium sp.]MBC7632270.1 DNRLRE domain-containing protein [Aeromicrobium sp.]
MTDDFRSTCPPAPNARGWRGRVFRASVAGVGALAVAVSVSLMTNNTASAKTSEVVLTPVESTFTDQSQPTRTHDRESYSGISGSRKSAYLKFDGSVLKGKTIVSASLKLAVISTTATSGGVEVHPSASSWSAKTLTANNRPADSALRLNSAIVRSIAGETVSIPISDVSTLSGGQFALRLSHSQKYITGAFGKKGSAAPRITIVVQNAPATSLPTASPWGNKVFAHYFPPYPVSIDNKDPQKDYYAANYLSPSGEGGKHAVYGGLLRDRPEGRAPIPSAGWKLEDMKTEVRQAKAAGIDGFTLNIMSASGRNWDAGVDLMNAADELGGFSVVPNLDASAGIVAQPVPVVAARLATIYSHKSAYTVGGTPVLSSFKAEGKSVAWWSDLIQTLKSEHGISTKFIAVFLNASDANMRAFAPISYGFGNWGTRTADSIARAPNYAAKAHALGKKWMAPVAVQDARPRNFLYAEANNTETLRTGWASAISTGADAIQLATWNDYSESTSFAPSDAHGSTFLDISARFVDWFHTGKQPAITQDALFVTHRIQRTSAVSQLGLKAMSPTLGGMSTRPRDTVEVLGYLAKPATVTVTVGSKITTFSAPAGVWSSTVPLGTGTIAATATRAGRPVASVVSPHPVVARPLTTDMQYYGASSLDR